MTVAFSIFILLITLLVCCVQVARDSKSEKFVLISSACGNVLFSLATIVQLVSVLSNGVDHIVLWQWGDIGHRLLSAELYVDLPVAIMLVLFSFISSAMLVASIFTESRPKDWMKNRLIFLIAQLVLFVAIISGNIVQQLFLFTFLWAVLFLLPMVASVDGSIKGRRIYFIGSVGDIVSWAGIIGLMYSYRRVSYSSIQNLNVNLMTTDTWLPVLAISLLVVGISIKLSQVFFGAKNYQKLRVPIELKILIVSFVLISFGSVVLLRLAPLIYENIFVGQLTVWIGAVICFIFSSASIAQRDVEKALIDVAIVNFGYICIGIGSGAVGATMFHAMIFILIFSALFILVSSICDQLGESDLSLVAGTRVHGRYFFWAGLVAIVVLISLPVIWSSEITSLLLLDFHRYGVAVVGVLFSLLLVTFCLLRLCMLMFLSEKVEDEKKWQRINSKSLAVNIPVYLFLLLGVILCFMGLPDWFSLGSSRFVQGLLESSQELSPVLLELRNQVTLVFISVLFCGGLLGICYYLYVSQNKFKYQKQLEKYFFWLNTACRRHWFFDGVGLETVIDRFMSNLKSSKIWFDKYCYGLLLSSCGTGAQILGTWLEKTIPRRIETLLFIVIFGVILLVSSAVLMRS